MNLIKQKQPKKEKQKPNSQVPINASSMLLKFPVQTLIQVCIQLPQLPN